MDLKFETIGKFDPIALYAAMVATAVALFDIFKWLREGPILQGSATPNMMFVGGYHPNEETYVIVDIINIGSQPTTIRGVYLEGYNWKWKRLRYVRSYTAVVNSSLIDSYPIPGKLEVGSNFKASCLQDSRIEQLSRDKRLFAVIGYADSRSAYFRIKPIASKVKDG